MNTAFATSNMKRPGWISARALLVINGRNEVSVWGEARVGDLLLAQLTWSQDGELLHEKPFASDGAAHGIETQRDESGRVIWCAQWVHGLMHGPVMQFDERSRPVIVTQFERGRGTDIWMNCGKVTEIREMADGVPHGLVRWGDPRGPWEEGHFLHGQRHGIFRQWQPDGALREGFPQYYLNDNLVPRHVYDATQAKEGALPRYDARDDSNRRTMPPAVREALKRAKSLRRELALVEYARRATVVRGDPQ
jgi:hypothetical protein